MYDISGIFAELPKYLPQLGVTFLGVFLAFMLDRAIDWHKRKQTIKDLLRDLRDELEETKEKLHGKGLLLYPDVWDSAVSSGQIRLLNSDQVTKLARVYRYLKGTEYEAKRRRDAFEEYKTHAVGFESYQEDIMKSWNETQMRREKNLRKMIEELLGEKWWNE